MSSDLSVVDLAVTVLVLAAAAYRLTRVIVLDDLLGEWPDPEVPGDRGTFVRKFIDQVLFNDQGAARHPLTDYVGKGYSCTFCVGWWVSLLVVCGWWSVWPVELGVVGWVVVFAVAGVQGYLSSRHNA